MWLSIIMSHILFIYYLKLEKLKLLWTNLCSIWTFIVEIKNFAFSHLLYFSNSVIWSMQAHNFDYYVCCVSEHTVQCKVCGVIQLSSVRKIPLTLWHCALQHKMFLHRLQCSGLRRILPPPLQVSRLECAWHYFNRQIHFIFKQTAIPSNFQHIFYDCTISSCCISLLTVFCKFRDILDLLQGSGIKSRWYIASLRLKWRNYFPYDSTRRQYIRMTEIESQCQKKMQQNPFVFYVRIKWG